MSARPPTYRQLEAFLAILETGSVTRAAERLHVSQPAISRLIAHLEADVGYPLFRRVGGRVVPTAEAELVREDVQRALSGVERAGRRIQQLAGTSGAHLTITAFPALATTTLAARLSAFRTRRPGLRLTLNATNTVHRMVGAVAEHSTDFAISNVPTRSDAVVSEHLCRYPAVCVVRPDHPFAASSRVALEAIAGEPSVALTADDDSQIVIARAFRERGIDLDPEVVVSHCATACTWVAIAGGCSIVDPFTAGEWHGQLARLETVPQIWLDLWVLRSSTQPLTRIAAECLEELRVFLVSRPEMVRAPALARQRRSTRARNAPRQPKVIGTGVRRRPPRDRR